MGLGNLLPPKTIQTCPHVKGSKGIVRMTPDMIAAIKGAVDGEDDEWALVCQGVRSEDGFLIEVTGWKVPGDQIRSSAKVDLPEFDLEPEDVLVIHSHHRMGAFFSGTDEKELNPRFFTSIVVAREKGRRYLGFDYLGTGRVDLPCGLRGEVPFEIEPTEGPSQAQIVRGVKDPDKLGDCPTGKKNYTTPDAWTMEGSTECGIQIEKGLRAAAFGTDTSLLELVQLIPAKKPMLTGTQGHGQGYSVMVNGVKICPHTREPWTKCHCGSCDKPFIEVKGKSSGGEGAGAGIKPEGFRVRRWVDERGYSRRETIWEDDEGPEESGEVGKESRERKSSRRGETVARYSKGRCKLCNRGTSVHGEDGSCPGTPTEWSDGTPIGRTPRQLGPRREGGGKANRFCYDCFAFVDLDEDVCCPRCLMHYCWYCEACHEGWNGCTGVPDIKAARRRRATEALREDLNAEAEAVLLERHQEELVPEGWVRQADGSLIWTSEPDDDEKWEWLREM